MTVNELLLNVKDVSFSSIICQADIKTNEDKEAYLRKGYDITFTESEFLETFDGIDPKNIHYSPSLTLKSFYFNRETLAVCPFHIDILLLDIPIATLATTKKVIAEREASVAAGEYLSSISMLPDRMKIEYFTMLNKKDGGKIDKLYQMFFSAYIDSDYGFNDMDKETLEVILASKTPADRERTSNAIRNLPDTVQIYRGGNSKSTDYREAYSWTLDINTANFFACRRGNGPAYIAEATIQKTNIIDIFLDERGEQEILVDPQKVRITKVTPIYGLEFLEATLPNVAEMYRYYRDKMLFLDLAAESECHGKLHQARVLMLTQIIAEVMNLPLPEREILATAAIYHDSKRTHDGEDTEHGALASRYYLCAARNPMVAFLCKYHCLPDKEGYKAIRKSRVLRQNQAQAERLLKIFKDADALDRVRFDIRDLDLNQLRLPVSKSLTLVARINYEQIKI